MSFEINVIRISSHAVNAVNAVNIINICELQMTLSDSLRCICVVHSIWLVANNYD